MKIGFEMDSEGYRVDIVPDTLKSVLLLYLQTRNRMSYGYKGVPRNFLILSTSVPFIVINFM